MRVMRYENLTDREKGIALVAVHCALEMLATFPPPAAEETQSGAVREWSDSERAACQEASRLLCLVGKQVVAPILMALMDETSAIRCKEGEGE